MTVWSDVAEVLTEKGWTQGDYVVYDDRDAEPAYCLLGAICEVAHVDYRILPVEGNLRMPQPGSEEARKLADVLACVHELAEAIRVKHPDLIQKFLERRAGRHYSEDDLVADFNDDDETDLDMVLALVNSLEERSEGDE